MPRNSNGGPTQAPTRWRFVFDAGGGSSGSGDLSSLVAWLSEQLTAELGATVSKARIRGAVRAGAVHVNRVRCRIPDRPLRPKDIVEIFSSAERLVTLGARERSDMPALKPSALEILFEDQWLVAVCKPAGLPTQSTLDKDRIHLFGLLQAREEERCLKAGLSRERSYIGLHHRLDRDTSGIVLFTRSKEANAGVARLFQERQLQKTYQAWVPLTESFVQKEVARWTKGFDVKNRLAQVSRQGKAAKFGAVPRGGDFAHTRFRLLAWSEGLMIGRVEAMPHTGRTHQIRVHLSELGYPILGDTYYGGVDRINGQVIPRMMLHASELEFVHPLTGKAVRIVAPWPERELRWLEEMGAL